MPFTSRWILSAITNYTKEERKTMKAFSRLILFMLLIAIAAAAEQQAAKMMVYANLQKKTEQVHQKKRGFRGSAVVSRKIGSHNTKSEARSTEMWQSLGPSDVASGHVGRALSMSNDGHTIAIATHFKDTEFKDYSKFGHVEVFHWDGKTWNQIGNRIDGDLFATVESVSISGDGMRVAIGEPTFNKFTGRVRVFDWNGESWTQMGQPVLAQGFNIRAGESVALSHDGTVLAVGAPGISTLSRNGQIRAYIWKAPEWHQLGQHIEGKEDNDQYGWSLALSADGHVLATGGYNEADESASVGVYELTDNLWVQMGSEFELAMTYDSFYINYLSLSSDGKTFALGEPGDPTQGLYAGRARVFHWDNGEWTQLGNDIFADSEKDTFYESGYFGYSVSLSSSGDMVAVGGPTHSSKYESSGRVVVLKWNGSTWAPIGQNFDGSDDYQYVGWSVALSGDGNTLAIGEPSLGAIGHVNVYQIPIAATSVGSQGDAQYKTWNGQQFQYHGQCDLMLLKDENFANGRGLQVQTRTKINRFSSFHKAVAIKIGNDVLEIEGSMHDHNENVYWANGVYQGQLKTLGGLPVKIQTIPNQHMRRVNFIVDLDSVYPGQKIVLSTWNEYVRVDIQNGTFESFGRAVGMLGDFSTGKGLSRGGYTEFSLEDDDSLEAFGNEWQVLPSDGMLFHNLSEPQFPRQCFNPDKPPARLRKQRRRFI